MDSETGFFVVNPDVAEHRRNHPADRGARLTRKTLQPFAGFRIERQVDRDGLDVFVIIADCTGHAATNK
jgi:hypothetical protein